MKSFSPVLPADPLPGHRLKLANMLRAADMIDPVFLNSPQFNCEPLSEALACRLTVKLETANPIRSFKGRGAGYLVASRVADGSLAEHRLVGANRVGGPEHHRGGQRPGDRQRRHHRVDEPLHGHRLPNVRCGVRYSRYAASTFAIARPTSRASSSV